MTDLAQLRARHQELKGRNLGLDMTRGKPSPDQLDLSDEIFGLIGPRDCVGEDGTDYRNYGVPAGIPEARRFFSAFIGAPADQVLIGGNSSLSLMYDAVAGATLFGVPGGAGPWGQQSKPKFICPVPGYDRHFAICERLGIEMVTVEMADDGPDMDAVEGLAAEDESVKGIWCVPKYSNPTGAVYSDRVVERLAAMPTAASDFRIFWDNAYAFHHLGDGPAPLRNILDACHAAGTTDRPLMFGSTSKITLAGAGVAIIAASKANIADARHRMSFSTIGHDKINQLRHVRLFGDIAGLEAHMAKHASKIAPKFAAVDTILERSLGGKGLAAWTRPAGGYFVSVDLNDGCAREVVRLANEAGVKLTPAGSTFPYGQDPRDRNIRLAPTMPPLEEVETAIEIFCTCVELASAEQAAAAG